MLRPTLALCLSLGTWLVAPLAPLAALAARSAPSPAQVGSASVYDVVWDTPSADASGSMPLGNGEVALNAWIEDDGTLRFYIARGDAWSENGRLLKLGLVKVSLDPAPSLEDFEQRLELESGTLIARMGRGEETLELRLWVDANAPCVHVEVSGSLERRATATLEPWRTQPTRLPRGEVGDLLEDRSKPDHLRGEVIVEPDTLIGDLPGAVGWFHHNARSSGPALIARLQGLEGYFAGKPDPLLGRTFGALLTTAGGERLDDRRLRTRPGTRQEFLVHVLTEHPATPESWLESVLELAASEERRDAAETRAAHESWWEGFWARSWIQATSRAAGEPRGSELVPRNSHPVRIGVDQHGGSRFDGRFGRLTILARSPGDEQIAQWARLSHDNELPEREDAQVLYRGRPEAALTLAEAVGEAFSGSLAIEAWILPDEPASGGRLVDKITPGAADGMLFDTYPGRDLRLIVGPTTLIAPEVLTPGRWSHVAAVIDRDTRRLALFVDGACVASTQLEDTLLPGGDEAALVSRAYALQRFIDACAGRGRYPIKFNGSLFTVPAKDQFGGADYRRWGPGYWWQNTRLPYLGMCTSGDFDLLQPLFRMYAQDTLELHEYRTRLYTGHAGAFLPECMYFWGPTFSATYGWRPFAERGEDKLQESPWHKREWVGGLELVWMMLDDYEHTLDEDFLARTLLPTAQAMLTFFDLHYATDAAGEYVMQPAQALETWWDVTGPMPQIAGLRALSARLLRLAPELTSPAQRELWRRVARRTPELPTWEKDGERLLAPAQRFAAKSNVENPELYAVYPFRLVSFEKPNAELGRAALRERWDRGHSGWRQDELFMAYLGLAEEARANLVARARKKDPGSRFPAFWGPNYDWVPDQDHGGVLKRALQTMLLQTEGRRIFLLPAWPREWDVDFKLHAPLRTTVAGRVRDGKLEVLEVQPAARRADIVICAPYGR